MSTDAGGESSGSDTSDDAGNAGDTTDTGGDSGPGTREVAYRLFATEFDDADRSYSESDEERAPNYVVTPTGLRVNRLFAVGVLTEVERLNSDTLRGRIVDPTGAFVTYAGQYQPEAQAFLDGAESPSFVAITGKARTFEPDDSDQIFTSVRPESLSEVSADTRDRWTVSAAEATLDRIAVFAAALDSDLRGDDLQAALAAAGVDDSLAAGIPRAIDHYGTTTAYLEAIRQCAVDALEVVADERDEVRPVEVAPDEGGAATLGSLPAVNIDLSGGDADVATADADTTADADATTDTDATADAEVTADSAATETTTAPTGDAESQSAATDTDPETGTTAETATASEPADEPPAVDAGVEEPDSTQAADEAEETAAEPVASEPAATADGEAPTAGEMTESPVPDDRDEESETVDTDAEADEPEMYQLDEEEREELKSEYGADFSSGNEVDPAGEADIDVPDADELAAEAEASDEPAADAGATTPDASETGETGETSETGESTETSDAAESTESAESSGTLGSFEDTIEDTDEPGAATAADAEPGDSTADEPATSDPAANESAASDGSAGGDTGDSDTGSDDAEAVDLEDAAVELMGEIDDGDGADREAVVAEVADTHGVAASAVEDAIDDALMSGRCYEPNDGTLKPI